ncbi:MAG: LacI family DNA-binding transcriptional regulator [Phycisphaerales bacterium]
MDDVATAAGVSTATVSRILNAPKLVAPATATRVMRVIKRLGYRPNRFAQGLMTRRSRVLGIVLPDMHGEFYSELLRGANARARRSSYHLLVTADGAADHGPDPIATAPFGLIDGLALMLTEPNEHLWKEARQSGLPMVVLDADLDAEGVDSVLIDNTSGAGEAIAHLLSSVPASRCYFVGGPRDNFDTGQRAATFTRALRGARHRPRPDQTAYGTYSPQWGRTWGAGMLERAGTGVIGVMAADDEIALGVLDALLAAGRSVPDDARIVGFNDSRLASLLRPALSSVRVPLAEVGAAAVEALINRIQHPESPVVRKTMPTQLMVRESSRGERPGPPDAPPRGIRRRSGSGSS